MPLYNTKQNNVVTVPLDGPTAKRRPVIDTASVYTNAVVNDPIVSHIEGSPWVVTYYGQHIGADDIISNRSDVTDPTLKQYQRVTDMEIRVTESLSNTTNESHGTTQITGAAYIYPVIAPIVGDLLIAHMGDGNLGLFEVTRALRKSIYKGSVWEVEYTVVDYVTPKIQQELDSFVVKDLIFDINKMGTSESPLRTVSQDNRTATLGEYSFNLVNRYYDEYFDKQVETFLYPSVNKVYDPYLVEYWSQFVSEAQLGDHPPPRVYDVTNGRETRSSHTVIDAIAAQSQYLLDHCVTDMGLVGVGAFGACQLYHTLVASGIDYVIQPVQDYTLIVPESFGDSYIFTPAFYAGTVTEMTTAERLFYRLIRREVLAFNDIDKVYMVLDTYSETARFYIIPLLITALSITR